MRWSRSLHMDMATVLDELSLAMTRPKSLVRNPAQGPAFSAGGTFRLYFAAPSQTPALREKDAPRSNSGAGRNFRRFQSRPLRWSTGFVSAARLRTLRCDFASADDDRLSGSRAVNWAYCPWYRGRTVGAAVNFRGLHVYAMTGDPSTA